MLNTIKWDKDNVLAFIRACRNAGGIPIFRTSYGGVTFVYKDGKPAVMGICWGSHGTVPSVLFIDVPDDIVETLKKIKDDWIWIMEYYNVPREQIEELEKKPITIL